MTERLRLDLPLLLPELPDARDACVARLESMLRAKAGITRVHVMHADIAEAALLCLHYHPEVLSLGEVQRIAAAAGARVMERFGHAVLPLRAVDGEYAARRIANALSGVDGVLSASVNLAARLARVEFDREITSLERVRDALAEMGYAPAPQAVPEHGPARGQPKEPVREEAEWYACNMELVWSLVAGALLILAWTGERWLGLERPGAIALYVASYGFGGFGLVHHWVGSVRRGRITFDIDLVMLLAALGAAVLGEWAEGAFLLFLFSLAQEHYALGRARGAIRPLADLAPPSARVLRGGGEMEVPVEQVAPARWCWSARPNASRWTGRYARADRR